jgi:hypothetical protein
VKRDPLTGRVVSVPLADRFWTKVDRTGECWLWTGHRFHNGYGETRESCGKKRLLTHRVAWELTNGPIPAGLVVLHSCDTRNCVRPSHLSTGTQRDNMADMDRKGRRRTGASVGADNGGAKLTAVQVREIRSRRASGETIRALAKEFEMSVPAVSLISRGLTWKTSESGWCPRE